MISAKKVYPAETREVEQITIRTGHPTLPRAQVVSPLRLTADAERQLANEIAERSAKLADARAQAVELQDSFDAEIHERNQERKNIAMYASTVQAGIARMQELRRWLETNFQDGHTTEQDAEYVRHQHLVEWLPALVEKSKVRLTTLDAHIAKLARDNDLQVPE